MNEGDIGGALSAWFAQNYDKFIEFESNVVSNGRRHVHSKQRLDDRNSEFNNNNANGGAAQ